MKLIDVLVRKENGSLPDGFKFKFETEWICSITWIYNNEDGCIHAQDNLSYLLGDELYVEENLEEEIIEICEETKHNDIEKLPEKASHRDIINKINEIIDYMFRPTETKED